MKPRLLPTILICLLGYALIWLLDAGWAWRSEVYKLQCEAKGGSIIHYTEFGECYNGDQFIPHSFME